MSIFPHCEGTCACGLNYLFINFKRIIVTYFILLNSIPIIKLDLFDTNFSNEKEINVK